MRVWGMLTFEYLLSIYPQNISKIRYNRYRDSLLSIPAPISATFGVRPDHISGLRYTTTIRATPHALALVQVIIMGKFIGNAISTVL